MNFMIMNFTVSSFPGDKLCCYSVFKIFTFDSPMKCSGYVRKCFVSFSLRRCKMMGLGAGGLQVLVVLVFSCFGELLSNMNGAVCEISVR